GGGTGGDAGGGTGGDAGGDTVAFEVRDTGIGIPEEARSRLFQSFSQVETAANRRFGGTGLGLAISSRIAELLGGRIDIDSAVGVGSRFTLLLPAPPDGGPDGRPDGHPDGSALAGHRVLVVDDNATDRELIDGFLTSWGMPHAVVAHGDGAAAALADGGPFDVVLVDLELGSRDGANDGMLLARRLAEHPRAASSRFVLLAPFGARERLTGGQLAGFSAVLTKPVKQSSLHDALMTVIHEPARHPAAAAPAAHSLEPAFARRHPMSILVAEDNPTNQHLLVKLLERLGYEPAVVNDGAAAVEAVLERPVDVVLMDIQMPRVDGLEAARRIRAGSGHQPWIVAVTANATPEDRMSCEDAGMNGYLGKPIRPAELVGALETAAGAVGERAADKPRAATSAGRAAPAGAAGPAEASDRSDRVLDPSALERLVELTGDRAFVDSLLAEFGTEADSLLGRVRASVPDAMDQVRLHSHSLKSSAANVGATALSECAARLEAAARDGDTGAVAGLVDELEREVAAAVAAVEALDEW
ncbi:MAG: response regulator, partial [Actinomycetota bacterium]